VPKSLAAWIIQAHDTLKRRIIQRAGSFPKYKGEITLTGRANRAVRKKVSLHSHNAIEAA